MLTKNRRHRAILAILAPGAPALVGCAASDAPVMGSDDRLAPVAFLEGTWRTAPEGGVWTEEHWSAPAGGCMLGGSRTIGPDAAGRDRLKFFEFLRIEAVDGGVVYHGAPMGRHPPTPFPLVESGATWVIFANPVHDFPRRIAYRLDDAGRLHATVAGEPGGSQPEQEWVFTRKPREALEGAGKARTPGR